MSYTNQPPKVTNVLSDVPLQFQIPAYMPLCMPAGQKLKQQHASIQQTTSIMVAAALFHLLQPTMWCAGHHHVQQARHDCDGR